MNTIRNRWRGPIIAFPAYHICFRKLIIVSIWSETKQGQHRMASKKKIHENALTPNSSYRWFWAQVPSPTVLRLWNTTICRWRMLLFFFSKSSDPPISSLTYTFLFHRVDDVCDEGRCYLFSTNKYAINGCEERRSIDLHKNSIQFTNDTTMCACARLGFRRLLWRKPGIVRKSMSKSKHGRVCPLWFRELSIHICTYMLVHLYVWAF